MKELDLERDLEIDATQLDVEWLEQPKVFRRYTKLLAQAQGVLERAEEKTKRVRSRLILKAWKTDGKVLGKGVKLGDKNVEAYYRTHEDHIAAKEAEIEAREEAKELDGVVFSFHQRKTALQEEGKLLGLNYFAAPTEPRDLPNMYAKRLEELRDRREEEVTDRIKAKMTRTKSKKKKKKKKRRERE